MSSRVGLAAERFYPGQALPMTQWASIDCEGPGDWLELAEEALKYANGHAAR